jgi:hypothetical protein
MKIFKALLLSVRGTENINHQVVHLEELARDAVEDGLAEKTWRGLRVC